MKNRFFSKKLYIDTLRRQRMMGLVLWGFCIAITLVINFARYSDYLASLEGLYSPLIRPVSIESIAPVLFVFVYFGSMLLVYGAFAFLNKRNGSDFYHSLPTTRVCLYTSTLASVITWVVSTVVSTVLISWLFFSITGMPFNALLVPYAIFYFLAVSILVCAVSALAVSITGTRFTNIILTGLILFLPRFILMITAALALSPFGIIVTARDLGIFLNPEFNAATGLFFASFMGTFSTDLNGLLPLMSNIPSMIYSFVLAAIYFTLAMVFFKKRKSECADNNAPSRLLQRVYSCCTALPLLSLAVFFFYRSSANSGVVLTLVVLSIICYLSYDLITTKSFKQMIKGTPYYLISVAVAFLILLVSPVVRNSIYADVPEKGDISAVKISSSAYYINDTYSNMLQANILYEDDELIEILTNSYRSTMDAIKNDSPSHDLRRVSFTFVLKDGRYMSRSAWVQYKDADRIFDLCLQDPKYSEALISIPPKDSIISLRNPVNVNNPPQLYESLMAEVSELSTEELIEYFTTDAGTIGYFNCIGSDGLQNFTFQFRISRYSTPKSAKLYTSLQNGMQAVDLSSIIELITNTVDDNKTKYVLDLSFSLYNNESDVLDLSLSCGSYDDKPTLFTPEMAAPLEILRNCTGEIDMTKPFTRVSIRLDVRSPKDGLYETTYGNFYVPLTQTQYEQLQLMRHDDPDSGEY